MLHLVTQRNDFNFSALMAVYAESNLQNGASLAPFLPEGQQVLQAEQDFYQYLTEVFFKTAGAIYAIWEEQGRYVSALRLEPYKDGLLLAALETAPEDRKKGYGERLIRAVQGAIPGKIYSHVSRNNPASLRLHQKCGFSQILDYAKYIDGSIARTAVTFQYR